MSAPNAAISPLIKVNETTRQFFLGPRGPLVEPSMSAHPSAPIFPEFIDEL